MALGDAGEIFQFQRIEPKLSIATSVFNMNMGWFISFVAKEEKSNSIFSEDSWHDIPLKGLYVSGEALTIIPSKFSEGVKYGYDIISIPRDLLITKAFDLS